MNAIESNVVAHGKLFSVAPMMDQTDRHCRYFHRQITRHALLYTEMITAQAVIHGDRHKLLYFDEREQPVALQLGGSDPALMAEAARIGEGRGYTEINMNVGCPSDRVQGGHFGACLMAEPHRVADCFLAMQRAVRIPVTIKCRIGIDDQDEEADFQAFVQTVAKAGCTTFIVHARKAWLQGLSPKENREIPPLDYDRVHRLKASLPQLRVVLNGGLESVPHAIANLRELDGVMLGRAACHTPWTLHEVDHQFTDKLPPTASRREVIEAMQDYIGFRLRNGVALHKITRHMLGLYHAQPGGRLWRQILSTQVHDPGAGVDLLFRALDEVEAVAQRKAEAA